MDIINIEVLDDGTLKVTTDQISGANHRNADELLKLVDQLMGGETQKARRKETHSHTTHHQHQRA